MPASSGGHRVAVLSPQRRNQAQIKHLLLLLLALLTAVPAFAAPTEQRPYSCRQFDDEQKRRAFGACG